MMLDLMFLAVLAIGSALLGRAVLSMLGALPSHRADALTLSVACGLGLFALAALGLGEIGRLDRAALAITFLAALGGVSGWHAYVRVSMSSLPGLHAEKTCLRGRKHATRGSRPASPMDVAVALCLGLAIFGTLLTALAPVTDGDALCYHLQVPKRFLLDGAVSFDPDLHETVYPLGAEMLYAAALAFRGPVACRLVQWLFGLVFAGCTTALARPVLGHRAWWAGAVALLVPAISNGMSAPLNDVALAAMANAALVAVMLWSDRPTIGRALAAGMVAGFAIGVKYPALVWAGVLGMVMLLSGWLRSRLRSPGDEVGATRPLAPFLHVTCFATAALLAGGWWYLRAFAHTGNPVFPFFREWFGGAGIADVLDPIKRPLRVTALNLITALAPMTLDPDRFDSVSHQFGPAFLLFVPGLFLLRPPRRIVAIASVGFAFLTLCLTQRQSMRFLLAAVGPFAVAVAWVALSWRERGGLAARGLAGLLALVLLFETTVAVGRARHGLGVVTGRETASEFLMRREPTYRVGLWIDAHLPPSARLIGQEHRGYYLPRPYAMELAHRRRTGLGTRGESPSTIIQTLRTEGFTHLLTCPPKPLDSVEFDGLLSRRLAPWLAARSPLYEEAITDPDGVTRRYRIDRLDDDSPRSLAREGSP